MDVPVGEVSMGSLLPALRTTADAFVAYGAEMSAAAGKPAAAARKARKVRPQERRNPLRARTIFVETGRAVPISAKMTENRGSTKTRSTRERSMKRKKRPPYPSI